MDIRSAHRRALQGDGYAIVPDAVDAQLVDAIARETADQIAQMRGRGGVRHLLRDMPAVRSLATTEAMLSIAEAALGAGATPVRGILFDKSPDANWKVIWHQDLTIAVRERREVEGFGPWSDKEGVPHVQPPTDLLRQMVAVRLHLDDCTSQNGPVRVIPRSHLLGRLTPGQIGAWRAREPAVECTGGRGGILAFHSLLLHASSPAQQPLHRRVVHIEYVGGAWRRLPGGLEWQESA